jgi:hypothetical protein
MTVGRWARIGNDFFYFRVKILLAAHNSFRPANGFAHHSRVFVAPVPGGTGLRLPSVVVKKARCESGTAFSFFSLAFSLLSFYCTQDSFLNCTIDPHQGRGGSGCCSEIAAPLDRPE